MADDLDISLSGNSHSDGLAIPCPRCGQPSTAIKIVDMPVIIFLWVFFFTFSNRMVVCPGCMRISTLLYTLLNVVTMNLISPFYLVVSIYMMIRSFVPGHSQEILDILRGEPNWTPPVENHRELPTDPAPRRRPNDGSFRNID